ncbi:MAG: glycosyltransferase [Candidatus Acidiferrales bacterium]
MHILGTTLLGIAALLWILQAAEFARGIPSMPSLADVTPPRDEDCPTVSILFAARDEAQKLPGALDTLLALDYPRYEIVAVDDRSEDDTGKILEDAARRDARLKHARVDSLPPGWLGKPHALQQAYERSSGEWIVFTDADVHFEPDLLRRSVALAEEKGWGHLTLLGTAKMVSIGEKIVMTFFGLGFLVGIRPWRVSDPQSRLYAGVGAFQMIHRKAYEAMGTHRRLAMEVVDDMKLGKLAKEAGIRSGVAKAGNAVSVHWHAGIGNIIRGTTKNFFATSGFRLPVIFVQVSALLLLCVFPVAALPFAHGWARAFDLIAVGLPVVAQGGVCLEFGVSPLYGLTYPVGALIFAWMLARSTIITLWQGGIVWRGTFYPLEELKRGVV